MKYLVITTFLLSSIIFAQVDIIPTLKHIENGEVQEAQNDFKRLKTRYPKDVNVKFLDAVLTENGEEALQKYSVVYKNYPESQFADAALYRVFSYYYSLGIYNKAEKYLTELKEKYPDSPYIKAADRTLPSEDFFIQAKNETTETPQKVVVKNKPEYKFTIQAGAFLNKTNAQNLSNKFKAKGLFTKIYTKEVGGSLLNIVLIGKFSDKNSAKPILNELKQNYKLNGRIVALN